MKNNKGFTLVEILAVIVLISLMMVIVVPNIQKVALNSKIKLCKSKITLAEEAINLWTKDNYKCFEKADGCNILSNCQTKSNEITCNTSLKNLADNNLINYDSTENNENVITNPINNQSINNKTLTIKYNTSTKLVTSTINEDICK